MYANDIHVCGNYFSSLKLILIKHLNWRQKCFCGISPILYVRYSGFSHKWHSTHALKYSFHLYCCFWGCIRIVCKSKWWLCCYLHCACLGCTCVLNYHDNAAFVQLFCDVSVHGQDGETSPTLGRGRGGRPSRRHIYRGSNFKVDCLRIWGKATKQASYLLSQVWWIWISSHCLSSFGVIHRSTTFLDNNFSSYFYYYYYRILWLYL